MSHLLILCPLQKELKHLLERLRQKKWIFQADTIEQKNRKNNFYHSQPHPEHRVTLATGGHGKVQFALQTQYWLTQFPDISAVVCLGAGGGLASYLQIGDLVIAEKTIEHDYKEKLNSTGRLPEFQAHPELLQKAQQLQVPFKTYFGVIASGDEDITNTQRVEELQRSTEALAVAWEGAGGAKACAYHEVPFLEIRTITDNARHSVEESFILNLPKCMHMAADFMDHFHQRFFRS